MQNNNYPPSSERPTPSLNNPEEVRLALQEWLPGALAVDRVDVSAIDIPEGNGMSNITVLFSVDCHKDGKTERHNVVGRLQANGDKLTFPDYNLALQYAFMAWLEKQPQCPGPALLAEETSGRVLGTPFYLMLRTEGRVPTDTPSYHRDGWMVSLSAEQQREMWLNGIDAMASLHNLDTTTPDAQALIASYAFPKSLSEQLDYWEHYCRWAFDDKPTPSVIARASAWLRAHQPPEQKLAFCWGDSRMPNVIFDSDNSGVAALLDWEMLALGDPLQDLAWWIYLDELFSHGLGSARLPGLPDRETSCEHWAAATGLDLGNLDYYLVFAGLRFGLIFARIMRNMGADDVALDNFVNQYLEQHLL